METLTRWTRTALRTVLRLGLVLMGALLVMAALFAAVLLTSGLVLWALVRGRRPALSATWGSRVQQARRRAQRVPAGEVVDIEVREVKDVREVSELPGPR